MPADGDEAALRRYWSLMYGDAHVDELLQLYPPAAYAAEAAGEAEPTHNGIPPHSLSADYSPEYRKSSY